MVNRLKENEKNEKIVRGLTKLSENRKCINCGSLGPQYVCTNFSIFICTSCSGIHREFTHRVKSISMATFTPAEVTALQAGGNQRAREIYFKEWDSSRQSLPDPSNPDKLRDFIKTVYVDKRFSGDRRERLSDAEEYDARKPDRSRYAQSPAYEDRDDRRYSTRSGSRGSDRGFDEKTSPARPDERYDRGSQNDRDRDRRYDERDRRFDDRDRRYEERDRYYEDRDRRYDDRDRRNEDRERRNNDRDRDRKYDYEEQRRGDDRETRGGNRRLSDDLDKRPSRAAMYRGGETPPLRSVRDILGEDVPKLRVEDGNRTNGRAEDGESPHSVGSSQGDGRLRSFKSTDSTSNGNVKVAAAAAPAAPAQPAVTESLIDFSVDSEPPKPVAPSATSSFDPFGAKPAAAPAAAPAASAFDPFGAADSAKTSAPFDPFAAADAKAPFDPFASSDPPKANAPFDPFAASEQPSSTSGWASFDTPPKPAAPAPAPTPAESFFNQTAADPVQVKPHVNGVQTVQWPPQQQPVGPNGWAQPGQDPWNSSSAAPPFPPQPQHPMQQPLPMQHQQRPQQPLQQGHPQPHPIPQQQGPADNGPQRREIPEDLFYVPRGLPFNAGMHMQMRPGFGFPQGPPGFGAPMPGPMPNYGPPSIPSTKSNPFDLAGDTNPSAFPNMAPLQSALPAFNAGPLSSPAPPPQWSHAGFGAPPASFPPASYPPGAPGFNQQQQMPPQMMPHFAQGHIGRPGSQMINGPMGFSNTAVQPAAGGGGGNPFG